MKSPPDDNLRGLGGVMCAGTTARGAVVSTQRRADGTGDVVKPRRPGHTIARAGVAALVAGATSLLMSCGQPGGSQVARSPGPTPTSSATSTATTSQPTEATGTPTYDSNAGTSPSVTLRFGPTTGTPRTAYAAQGVFHDGTRTVALPVSRGIQSVARLEGGRVLVVAPAQDRIEPAVIVDGAGRIVARLAGVRDAVVTDDGSRIATADSAGMLRLHDAGGKQLASLPTRDNATTLGGMLGVDVYYTTTDAQGVVRTRVWRSATGVSDDVIVGRIRDIDEGTSTAIVWPNQDFVPERTCYWLLELGPDTIRYVSCGEFAPIQFIAEGSMVVGPNVADGPGSSRWKLASTKDGSVLLRVVTPDGFAPSSFGADTDALVVGLLNGEPSSRQAIASCTLSPRACTVDTDAVAISPQDANDNNWPIILSMN